MQEKFYWLARQVTIATKLLEKWKRLPNEKRVGRCIPEIYSLLSKFPYAMGALCQMSHSSSHALSRLYRSSNMQFLYTRWKCTMRFMTEQTYARDTHFRSRAFYMRNSGIATLWILQNADWGDLRGWPRSRTSDSRESYNFIFLFFIFSRWIRILHCAPDVQQVFVETDRNYYIVLFCVEVTLILL